jgi:hypothetical protein
MRAALLKLNDFGDRDPNTRFVFRKNTMFARLSLVRCGLFEDAGEHGTWSLTVLGGEFLQAYRGRRAEAEDAMRRILLAVRRHYKEWFHRGKSPPRSGMLKTLVKSAGDF